MFVRFDKYEEFQVSNLELKKFAAFYDIEVCLVNCCLELTQENVSKEIFLNFKELLYSC